MLYHSALVTNVNEMRSYATEVNYHNHIIVIMIMHVHTTNSALRSNDDHRPLCYKYNWPECCVCSCIPKPYHHQWTMAKAYSS